MAKTVVGLSGSVRRGSLNSMLLRAASELVPEDLQVEIASIRDIPLYDGDLEERDGVPAPVRELKDRIALSDGLLLATPEYNNSLPGVLKNAIDWLTRPPKDIARVFGERPVALMGATPGPGGTILAQAAWLQVLRTLGTRPWCGPRMMVSRADTVFDGDGRLTDEALRGRLRAFMEGFARFIG
jgi:NAD(P)H-dependent FMN reductase